jgi:hypothetical protein
MKPVQAGTARPSVAVRFRAEIERAAMQGVALEDMTLHLTLGDVAQLKRDRAIPLADISFAGGTMTYLGVRILKGDAAPSVLRLRAPQGA